MVKYSYEFKKKIVLEYLNSSLQLFEQINIA